MDSKHHSFCCPHCGKVLAASDLSEYVYQCEDCDEDEDDTSKKKDDKKRKDKKDDEDENDKINAPIKVNSFSTVLNPVGTFEDETADDYLDLFDDDDDDYDDL